MIQKSMQRFFLLCALVGMSFAHTSAAVLDSWVNGQTITSVRNINSLTDADSLSLDGSLTVSGDVWINARLFDLTINVTTDNVTLKPYNAHQNAIDNLEYGQLIFYAATDKTITVSCAYDLNFTGSYGGGADDHWKDVDMVVTFTGAGQTVFQLKDNNASSNWSGAQVAFTGFASGARGSQIHRAGTRAYIVMDQTEAQAITSGENKVVFERMGYGGSTADSSIQARPTGVYIGPGSYLTYLSTNATGLTTETNLNGGFGALAFDPTHEGTGRMYLKIAGDSELAYNFNDGGIIVSGHFLGSSSPAQGTNDFNTAANFRRYVYMSATAGQKAIFRITDSLAYVNDDSLTYDPASTARRGLLVINENTTVPKLAADPYGDYGNPTTVYSLYYLETPNSTDYGNMHSTTPFYWAYDYAWYRAPNNYHQRPYYTSLNVQTGFVMGVNGWMDIYHQTFLDYVAANINTTDRFSLEDIYDYTLDADWTYAARSTDQYIKSRNPAAFTVDGLNYYSNYNSNYADGTYYQAADPDNTYFDVTKHAHVVCYGDARMYLRCSMDKDGTAASYGPRFTDDGDLVYTLTVGTGTYDGKYISSTTVDPVGEGANVLDVQGHFSVWSKERNDAPARTDAYTDFAGVGVTEQGMINLPTVQIDYLGEEYTGFSSPTDITRPLTMTTQTYAVYNSPSIFMNDKMELHGMLFNHSDVLKSFPFIPTGGDLAIDPYYASPAIVGGERKFVTTNVWSNYDSNARFSEFTQWPRIWMFNSTAALHENLCSSGLRWLGQELVYTITGGLVANADADNTSVIKYYDHGDALDTLVKGYGRMFMLGTAQNKMSGADSNGRYTNSDTESAFCNFYRANKVTNPTSTIKLSLQQTNDSGASSSEIATHLFMLSRLDYNLADPATQYTFGKAYMTLGWTTTVGDQTLYPWGGVVGASSNQFSLDADTAPQATISVDGNYIYFGGTDVNGHKCINPVSTATQGSVVYLNHGGRMTIGQPLWAAGTQYAGEPDWSASGYNAFVDTMIASRLWSTESLSGTSDLPKDQVIFGDGFGRQFYDVNTARAGANVRLNVYNSTTASSARKAADKKVGEEVTVSWRNRAYDADFTPVKSFGNFHKTETRWTAMPTAPVTLPDNLLYITKNDLINQLKIAGATSSDPFSFLVTGDGTDHGYGRVREVVSVASNPVVPGEGDHASIFLNNSGSIGLGSRAWNKDSKTNSWTRLGKDHVTIYPVGMGIVDVNSNLIVADKQAIIPTTDFGATLLGPNSDISPRVTFISEEAYEIRVPSGVELDLSAFGQADSDIRQEIAFGGRLRLIFEAGSALRFPAITDETAKYPVLYMNDDSEIIFEGNIEKAKSKYADITETDADKVKIIGCGQIWLNKNAKMYVLNDAKVAVQSDDATKLTDIIVSIQRQGEFWIGDANIAGGSFEVGNPTELDITTHKVNFSLLLNGPKARFHIDREGFFGLGVGVVNKEGNPNGGAQTTLLTAHVNPSIVDGTYRWLPDASSITGWNGTAWQVAALGNLHQVNVVITKGIFDHSNIFDGTSSRASVLALGPITTFGNEAGEFLWEVADPVQSVIRGGGNVMTVEEDFSPYVNIWAYSDVSVRMDSDDDSTGDMYGIMASAPIVLQQTAANIPDAVVTQINGGGLSILAGDKDDVFTFIKYPIYSTIPAKKVDVGETEFQAYVDYVLTASQNGVTVGGDIYRTTNIPMIGEGRAIDGTETGVLLSTGSDAPDQFIAPLTK